MTVQNKTLKVIGVIHLLPLPGTPWGELSLQDVLERALYDAMQLRWSNIAILENL